MDFTQTSSSRLTKFLGLCVIWPPNATIRRSRFCQSSFSGSAGISPSMGPDRMTKLVFGLSVKGSISSGLPLASRSQSDCTKLAMCHRSSIVVLSANDGIGVPLTPVENVRKMFFTLYGSWRLPLKFQHLCQLAGWIGNPQSSFRLNAFPSPCPSTPWHSIHFLSTTSWAPFSMLSLLGGIGL